MLWRRVDECNRLHPEAAAARAEQIHLDFVARDKSSTRAHQLIPGMTVLDPPVVAYPLRLEPRGRLDYFMKRQGFSMWGIVSNPMILMTGFVLLLGYFLPKLTEGIGTSWPPTAPRTGMQRADADPPHGGKLSVSLRGPAAEAEGAADAGAAATATVAATATAASTTARTTPNTKTSKQRS